MPDFAENAMCVGLEIESVHQLVRWSNELPFSASFGRERHCNNVLEVLRCSFFIGFFFLLRDSDSELVCKTMNQSLRSEQNIGLNSAYHMIYSQHHSRC
jgi:hypothetical protein